MLNNVPKRASLIELNNKLLLLRSERSSVSPLKNSRIQSAITWICSRGIDSNVKFATLITNPNKNKNIEPGTLNLTPNLSHKVLIIRSNAKATNVV